MLKEFLRGARALNKSVLEVLLFISQLFVMSIECFKCLVSYKKRYTVFRRPRPFKRMSNLYKKETFNSLKVYSATKKREKLIFVLRDLLRKLLTFTNQYSDTQSTHEAQEKKKKKSKTLITFSVNVSAIIPGVYVKNS